MKLLRRLYSIHSMSGQETPMRKFIKSYVKGLPGDIVCTQKDGNIYITKGEAESYPCLVAHLDQVQKLHSADFRTIEIDGNLYGFSQENERLEGLGADDKNGIWIALKCLEKFPALKIAFFKEEEIGCGGSSKANLKFFEDCRYCIQADRKNGGDLITEIGWMKIASEKFVQDITPIAEKYDYKETSGLMTDVETLVERGVGIACINMSCGYHSPHTDNEHTNIAELYNSLAFVCEVLSTLTDIYPHEPQKDYGYYGGFYGYGWEDDFDDSHFGGYFIPSLNRYYELESWVEDIMYYNHGTEDVIYKIWPLVQADCDTLGITEEDFIDMCYNVVYAYGYDWQREEDETETLRV